VRFLENVFKPLDPRVASELKKQRKPIAKGLICVAVTSSLAGAMVPFVGWTVKSVEAKDSSHLLQLSGLIVLIFLIKYWFTRGQTYYLSQATSLLTTDLRIRIFEKLQKLPVSYFNQTRSGIIQSVIDNDVGLYQSAVMIVRDSIDGPVRGLIALVSVALIQWQLAVVAIILLPFMAAVIQNNGKKMKLAQAQVQVDQAELQAMTQESLYGVRVVKAFSAEERVSRSYEELAEATYRSQMSAVHTVATLRPLVELIGGVALSLVLVVCGFISLHTQFEAAKLAAVVYGLEVVNSGFRTLGYVNSSYNSVQAGASRIYDEILDQPVENPDEPNAIELPVAKGLIEFKNVSFTYADGTEALRDISFTIEPGTSLALVGSSGAGKSTIADLLLRFYKPTSGQILFDGHDISELKQEWLRAQIGVVPQQTFLFAGTIADNIRLGKNNATDSEVEDASKAAHASIFIDGAPNGYETIIGESGVGLSGGEKQRVAIARALVRKPTVLLLDEATSSLDAVSEKAVQEALNEIMKQRTTLFIAHRLTSAARADRILMLRRGEIVESGSHQELMKKEGAYAAMYKAFSSGVLDESLV
jgi:subfamily B ATP-binding cassette protein MsbA